MKVLPYDRVLLNIVYFQVRNFKYSLLHKNSVDTFVSSSTIYKKKL